MVKVLFVCHGNICRSPMAEYLFKDYVKKRGKEKEFFISSCATSYEEVGNPVYPPVKRLLKEQGIDCSLKRAVVMEKRDYRKYDFILGMDENNIRNILQIIGEDTEHKIHLLSEYAGSFGNIRDPWYTRDFNEAYRDIIKGINGFYQYLEEKNLC